MSENDPFAAVAAQQSGQSKVSSATGSSPAPAADPFTGAHDSADPFATSDNYRGGDFTPSPGLEALRGRLCVMIPRSFDPAAADPNNPGKTREMYTVDLTVLDGGPLRYFYKQRGNPEAENEADRLDQVKEWEVEDISPTSPFTIGGFWVPQGGIVGKLKKAHRDGAPFLGVVTIVPVAADRGKKTLAQVANDFDNWVKTGRASARPRYSWSLETPAADRRAGAIQWWASAKDSIDPINRADAPAAR